MTPKLKPGTIVDYISSSHSPCTARVIEVDDKGYKIQVLTINHKPYTDKNNIVQCTYADRHWEMNQFKIRLQLIKGTG